MPQKADLSKEAYETWRSSNPTLSVISETLGFTHVFTSFWFITVLLVLFLSLVACEYTQAKTAFKSLRAPFVISQEVPIRLPFERKILGKDRKEICVALGSVLKQRRFKVINANYENESQLRARRFYFGWLGSPLFHLGLILILIGAIISAATRMQGYFELGEGQTLAESHSSYIKLEEGPFFKEQHKEFEIELNKFVDEYWPNGALRRVQSEITLFDQGVSKYRGTIEVNEPLKCKGAIIYQSYRYFGYATKLTLHSRGEPASTGLVYFPRSSGGTAETIIYPPETDYSIDARLFYEKKPAILQLHVKREGETVYTGTIKLSQAANFEETSLRFDEVLRWSGFSIVQDRGVSIILNSFWLSFAALLMIIFFTPQELVFTITDSVDGVIVRSGGRGKRRRLAWGQDVKAVAEEVLLNL